MSTTIFQLQVELKNSKAHKTYSNKLGMLVEDASSNHHIMKHIRRRTQDQAVRVAEKKYGHVTSVCKVDKDRMRGTPKLQENIPDSIQLDNPFKGAVAADEMMWMNHQKRRFNMTKEKQKYLDK